MNHHAYRLLQGRQLCGEIGCRWHVAVGVTCCVKTAPRINKKMEKQEGSEANFAIIANLSTSGQKKLTTALIAKIFNPHSL